ncbi:hypothetical protein PV325_007073 [Microctonus aethiopoides]|uniref:CCHC-type domain-containing protein n=1 Tax=Microctonus aethiopoides TaxID=144406 RepID=A0AA39F1I2_9HYME|nr:hypothetical protein PV325_007073 [Microctonus aethiopoides]KAK0079690.1 hypothetical protein PV326_008599 [Microctonus aethiopoides]KAK0160198.1 hypothetical protein PV328_007626 [Microctonus aethiopoides]
MSDLEKRIVAETLRDAEDVQPNKPLAIEWKELPMPRGALPRTPQILLANYEMIVAGRKCRHCNVLPPTRVIPFPQDQPNLSQDRPIITQPVVSASTMTPSFSANDRLRLKQPPKDSTVLPLYTREERKACLAQLLNILRVCPNVQRYKSGGCYNCTGPHHHRDCPYRRGTFCGRCGESGMVHEECPRCYPEQYGLEGVISTPTSRRG